MKQIIIKIFLIAVSLVILVGIAYWISSNGIWKSSPKNPSSQPNQTIIEKVEEEAPVINPSEQARNKILEISQLQGIITEILDPIKDNNGLRLITVQADVIDNEKIKEITFSQGSRTLPMVRKEFKVIINNSTSFNQGDIKKINPGDFVSVILSNSIYGDKELSATSIEIFNQNP